MARRDTSSFMVPVALSGWLVCERAGCRALISAGLAAAQRGLAQERKSGRLSPPLRPFAVCVCVWGRG